MLHQYEWAFKYIIGSDIECVYLWNRHTFAFAFEISHGESFRSEVESGRLGPVLAMSIRRDFQKPFLFITKNCGEKYIERTIERGSFDRAFKRSWSNVVNLRANLRTPNRSDIFRNCAEIEGCKNIRKMF